MAARRRMWKAAQPFIDPERPILLDETGVNTRMARLYGWAPVGKRYRDSVSFGHWKTMTFIAGLRLSGLTAPGSSMVRWMTRLFASILRRCRHRPRHAVMSWCSTTCLPIYLPIRSPASVMIIVSPRARIFYLPPYSPDMNPIEMAFARLKALLGQDPARTVDALVERIGCTIDCFLPAECENVFHAAGYQRSM